MEDISPRLLEGLTPEQRIRVMQLLQRKRLAKMAEEKLNQEKSKKPAVNIRGTNIFGFRFGNKDEE